MTKDNTHNCNLNQKRKKIFCYNFLALSSFFKVQSNVCKYQSRNDKENSFKRLENMMLQCAQDKDLCYDVCYIELEDTD